MSNRTIAIGWLLAVVCISIPLYGQETEPQFDWLAVQGEYAGELTNQGKTFRAGVHIIATGDDGFQMSLYQGGLPGDGFEPPGRMERQSRIEDGNLVFGSENRFVFQDGALVADGADNFTGRLERVERESDTLGKAAPDDATILFDGGDHQGFAAQDGGDPVVDGLLRQGIISDARFGDFQLHIEFKLPFEPTKTGQARGNSGIYLQGRYEVQMLDSFGLGGEHNECGGIYSIKKPDVNMCYPPESWQTYDIDFTAARWNEAGEKTDNARMTVRHNGVLIHDDVELPKTTTAAPLEETAEPGYIYLQNHGSPVRYRNIWVVEK